MKTEMQLYFSVLKTVVVKMEQQKINNTYTCGRSESEIDALTTFISIIKIHMFSYLIMVTFFKQHIVNDFMIKFIAVN